MPYPLAPDLQEWIEHYGDYWKIPWDTWDEYVDDWQRRRLNTLYRRIEDMLLSELEHTRESVKRLKAVAARLRRNGDG